MGNERGVVMKGFVQDSEGLRVKNNEFRRVALHGKGLPARRHGVKAQGRDRGGSPQARPVLSRGRGGRRGGSRWSSDGDQGGLRGRRASWGKSQHHQYRERSRSEEHTSELQ